MTVTVSKNSIWFLWQTFTFVAKMQVVIFDRVSEAIFIIKFQKHDSAYTTSLSEPNDVGVSNCPPKSTFNTNNTQEGSMSQMIIQELRNLRKNIIHNSLWQGYQLAFPGIPSKPGWSWRFVNRPTCASNQMNIACCGMELIVIWLSSKGK